MDAGSDSAPTDGGTDQVVESDSGQDAADADAQLCVPGTTESCYTGQAGTETIGACKPGIRVCAPGGLSFGECIGEVTPATEVCATPVDDDCDGEVNEEGADCACVPGSSASCYSGPAATLDVGACKAGMQVCKPDGSGFGPCFGEVIPGSETCATPTDEDCDGEINEEGAGCVCLPGAQESCYSGPSGTQDVGACTAGIRTCDGLGTSWSTCAGEVLPSSEQCSTPADDDCDGDVNEDGADCVCSPGNQVACYSAAPSTLGVGVCKLGSQTCNSLGSGYGACSGEITPTTETCATVEDEDCDGVAECPGDANWAIKVPSAVNFIAGTMADLFQAPQTVGLLVEVKKAGVTSDHLLGFDAAGTLLQDIQLPLGIDATGMNQYGSLVLVGRYIGAPNFGGTTLPNSGYYGTFIAKLNTDYSVAWVVGHPVIQGAGTFLPNTEVGKPFFGRLFVAGDFQGTVDIGNGPMVKMAPNLGGLGEKFVAAYSEASGALLWSRRLRVAEGGAIHRLDVEPTGDYVFFAGEFSGTIDIGSGPITAAGSGSSYDVLLAAFDHVSGALVWAKRYGGSAHDDVRLSSFTTDALGLAGSGGGIDFGIGGPIFSGYAAVFDSSGTPHSVGKHTSEFVVGSSLFTYSLYDSEPRFHILTNTSFWSTLVARAADGTAVWTRHLPEDTMFVGYDDSYVYVAGEFSNTVDFGTGGILTNQGSGVFLAKLSNN